VAALETFDALEPSSPARFSDDSKSEMTTRRTLAEALDTPETMQTLKTLEALNPLVGSEQICWNSL